MKYLYLLIDGLTIIGPLLLSFDKKVAFYKDLKPLFLSLFVMMLVFVPWDVAFTEYQIWGFNEQYLSGIYIFNLPIEELLFFIVVPSCLLLFPIIVCCFLNSYYFLCDTVCPRNLFPCHAAFLTVTGRKFHVDREKNSGTDSISYLPSLSCSVM